MRADIRALKGDQSFQVSIITTKTGGHAVHHDGFNNHYSPFCGGATGNQNCCTFHLKRSRLYRSNLLTTVYSKKYYRLVEPWTNQNAPFR